MVKKIKGWITYNQDMLVLNAILSSKVLIFSFVYASPQNLIWLIATTIAVVLMLTAWTVLLPSLVRQSALLVLDVGITLLLIADSVFMRSFHRILPVPALFQVDQLPGISGSIGTILSVKDFLFALDLVLIVPFFAWVFIKQKTRNAKLRFKVVQAVMISVLCVGLLFFKAGNTASASNTASANTILLDNVGVLNFHLADLYHTINSSKTTTLTRSDVLALQAWNSVHQLEQNNYRGAAIGKNLIIIQMESMQNFLINRSVNGQEITPNLNKLLKSSMYFDNYFVQVAQGNSSDAEFMAFTSLYPQQVGASLLMYPKNKYIALPSLLKDIGYNTFVIHGDVPSFWGRGEAYPAMGIDRFFSKNELTDGGIIGMGLSDREVFKQAIPIIQQAKKPFMSMIITLSGHHPFILPQSQKELSIRAGEYSQIFVDYLQAQHYADKVVGSFIDTLDKDGILDNSLLVIYGDHFGSGWKDSEIQKFLSINMPLNEYKQMELKKVPLIIRFPKAQFTGVQHQSGGQMDLLPTVANLMGLERRNMLYFGQDLLNEKDGFSVFRYYTGDGSFATNDFIYLASNDGVFEHGHAYSRKTGQEIDVELMRGKYKAAKRQLELSDHLIKGNAIPAVTR